MKLFFNILKPFVFLVIVAVGLFVSDRERALEFMFGPMDNSPINFASLTLTEKPNQFLVCPANFCSAEPMLEISDFPVSVAELRARWQAVIAQAPRVELIAQDEAEQQYDYMQRSDLMRFPDTITVKFISLGESRSTLAIYSRSHYGYSDLGANQARIEGWLSALDL